ncbi:protein of unknown function [Paraburkholderia kururiensis]
MVSDARRTEVPASPRGIAYAMKDDDRRAPAASRALSKHAGLAPSREVS